MSRVAIVTDSTANIPSAAFQNLPIYSVPQLVLIQGKTYRDGIDIQPHDVYSIMQANASIHPTTSQTSPSDFKNLYSQLLDDGYDILSIHPNQKLSGIFNSALTAQKSFDKGMIEVVDSESVSMPMGFQVLAAARLAVKGATLNECKIAAEKVRNRSGVLFLLSSLEYVRRGGRIGGAAALLGTLLNIKPILELKNGRIEVVARVRTTKKAVECLIEMIAQRVQGSMSVHLASLHANAEEMAQRILAITRQRLNGSKIIETYCSEVSPTIGVHAGPGAVGLVYALDG